MAIIPKGVFGQQDCSTCPEMPGAFEKVNHGDFPHFDCMGFGSNYTSVGCDVLPNDPGEVTQSDDAGDFSSNWTGVNHTSSTGSDFLIFNGSTTTATNVWFQNNIPVTPGETYRFSAFVINICDNGTHCPDRPSFELIVNDGTDHIVASIIDLQAASSWQQICGLFPIPAGVTSVNLAIRIPVDGASGNDGGIDDISFKQAGEDPSFTLQIITCDAPINFTSLAGSGNHMWDFGDGQTSTDANPSHTFPGTGTYFVKHTVTTACGVTSATIRVRVPSGCCICEECGDNLVTNGEFNGTCSTSQTQYLSDFTPVSATNCDQFTVPGQRTETSDAHLANGQNWYGLDHTGKPGSRFLVVDGFTSGGLFGDPIAWAQENITVVPGKKYCFSAWFKNLCDCPDITSPSAILQIEEETWLPFGSKIKLSELEDLAYNDCVTGWTKQCGVYTPGPGVTKIHLRILVPVGTYAGNDLGIDDIIFSEQSPPNPDFFYAVPTCGNPYPFTPVDNKPGSTHIWDFGDGSTSTDANPSHTFPIGDRIYFVKHTITTSCGTTTITKPVEVYDCCCSHCPENLVPEGNFSEQPGCYSWVNPPTSGTDIAIQQPCQWVLPPPAFTAPDMYFVKGNANGFNDNTWAGQEHTGDGIGMLLIDGQLGQPGGAKRAWYKQIPVVQGREYCFTAWVMNPDNVVTDPGATIQLRVGGVNGVLLNSVSNWPHANGWGKLCGTYIATTTGLMEFDIVIRNGQHTGYDIAIDDIWISQDCTSLPDEGGGGGGGSQPYPMDPMHKHGTDPARDGIFELNPGTENSENGDNVAVSPVPIQRGKSLNLIYTSQDEGNVLLEVYDASGKVVSNSSHRAVSGSNTILVPTDRLKSGNYRIRVVSTDFSRVVSFIVVE